MFNHYCLTVEKERNMGQLTELFGKKNRTILNIRLPVLLKYSDQGTPLLLLIERKIITMSILLNGLLVLNYNYLSRRR